MRLPALSYKEIFKELDTSRQGLTEEEVQARLQKHGPNEIQETGKTPLILKFLANFYHLMAIMLWAAALLAFLSDQPQLGYAVIGVIVINALFSFGQESRRKKRSRPSKSWCPSRPRLSETANTKNLSQVSLRPVTLY